MTQTPAYVICLKCGTHNPPGEDFCKNCGAYLPFEGIPGGTPPAPRRRSAKPSPSPLSSSPRRRPTAEDARFGCRRHRGCAPSARSRRPGTARPEPRPPPVRRCANPRRPPRRARPAAPQLPAEPAAAPDDVICPSCGTRNRPDRRFCRRCANPLWASSPLAGAPMQPAAGTRPKTWNTRFPFTAVVVLLVLLGLLVVAWLNRDVVIGFVETIVGFVFSSQSP